MKRKGSPKGRGMAYAKDHHEMMRCLYNELSDGCYDMKVYLATGPKSFSVSNNNIHHLIRMLSS